MAICCILRPFGVFSGNLVYFTGIWYILRLFGTFPPTFGMLKQEKSGNPVPDQNWKFKLSMFLKGQFIASTVTKEK
jgi:hypothetical protein